MLSGSTTSSAEDTFTEERVEEFLAIKGVSSTRDAVLERGSKTSACEEMGNKGQKMEFELTRLLILSVEFSVIRDKECHDVGVIVAFLDQLSGQLCGV